MPAEFRRPQPIPGADWFAEEVRRQLIGRFGADVTTQGGLMVRTSLDPALQIAAEKALRDGLMAYDRKMGGWRGPVAHLDGGAGACATDWAGAAGAGGRGRRACCRTGGSPSCWTRPTREAEVGWLDPAGRRGQAPQQRTGTLPLSDLAWARPVQGRQARAGAAADGGRRAGRRRGDDRARRQPPPAGAAARAQGAKPPPAPAPAAPQPRRRCGRSRWCRARWSRSIRRPAGCWRWSAAGASRAASSTAPPRRSASRAPASSRSSI